MESIVKINRTRPIVEPKEIVNHEWAKTGMYFLDTTGICD